MLLPCMTIPPSFSCENATSFYTRAAFLVLALRFGVIFMIVGATSGRPPFFPVDKLNELCYNKFER